MADLIVIGGGLSGCEAAWQAAKAGLTVDLVEMRPKVMTSAHTTPLLAELVCSNSLGSSVRNRPSGLLKAELNQLDSFVLECALNSALPAGNALAVDREGFAKRVTNLIEVNPLINVIRDEITEIPQGLVIIATGPLTSTLFSKSLIEFLGKDMLFFYDALAPIIESESIDMKIAFRASRYDWDNPNQGDYINCPLNQEQYNSFITELITARRIDLNENENVIEDGVKTGRGSFFEGCLPIEVLASRDLKSLAFGPLRPVGLKNLHDGSRPYAVLQLRQDDIADTLYNLVGFQTNLAFSEQKRVFRMIPGLEKADFVRFGQMHRNTYICAPDLLFSSLQCKTSPDLFFAGQITGIEGYLGNVASGLVAGINAARLFKNQKPIFFPPDTMTGALTHYIANADPSQFQPMKANFGLLPVPEVMPKNKQEKGYVRAKSALRSLQQFCQSYQIGRFEL